MRKSVFRDTCLKHIKAHFYTTGNELVEVVNASSTSKPPKRLDNLTENRPMDTRGRGRDVPTDIPRQQLWSLGRTDRWTGKSSSPPAVSLVVTWGQRDQSPLVRHFLLSSDV